jgi:hypothetical protein
MDNRIEILKERQKTLNEALKQAKQYMLRRGNKQTEQDFKDFECWIKSKLLLIAENLDTCPACLSNPHKIPGGCPCKRCGLIGQQPWGG